jgi:signal transduction histidine kinase
MSFKNQQIPLRTVLKTYHGVDLPTIALTSSQQIALGQQLIGLAAEQTTPVLIVTGFASGPPWGAVDRLPAGVDPQWMHLHHPEWAQDSWLLLLTGPAASLLLLGADRPGEEVADVLLSFDPELVGVALSWLAQHDADHAVRLRAAQQGAATSRLDPQLVGQVTAAIARLSSAPPAPAWDGEAEQRWRDALLSGLVHDMRTPLNAVSAALELCYNTSPFRPSTSTGLAGRVSVTVVPAPTALSAWIVPAWASATSLQK